MIDNNEINISPDSQLVFQKYEYDDKLKKKDVLLNVIYGKVRSKVKQKYDGKTSKFQVKTPAAVAGVRGTDFLTSYDQKTKSTNVVTFEGEVTVGTAGPGGTIQNPVSVTKGQSSNVALGQRASPPRPVPASSLQKINSESDAEQGSGGTSNTEGGKGSTSVNEGETSESDGQDADNQEPALDSSEADSDSNGDEANSDQVENPSSEKSENETAEGGGSTDDGSSQADAEPSAGAEDQKGPSGAKGGGSGPDDGKAASPNSGESSRAPSSSAGGGGSGLLMPEDFAGSDVAPMPENPTNFIPVAPPVIPVVEQIPICDFCNRVIENGPARVLIRITN